MIISFLQRGVKNPGIIKMECVPKEDSSLSERPRFFIYTSYEDREIVGKWLRRHVSRQKLKLIYYTRD